MGKPNRIREWRDARGLTLEDLADQSGISLSYLSRMERGDRNVSLKSLGKISSVLRVASKDLVASDDSAASYIVSVRGRIGAGAEILPEFEQIPPEGLFEVEVSIPVAAGALAFEVEGESMWPRYDPGDVIICGTEGTNLDQVIGWEAAVRTADGRRYLKRIRRGSKAGLFDLESHNASPIRDVAIEWVAEIDHVVRAGRWRKLDRAAQTRLVERTRRKGG